MENVESHHNTNVPNKAAVMSTAHVSDIAKTMVREGLIREGHRVLSIASGIGLDEAYLVQNVHISLIGTDLDDDFLTQARARENNRLIFQKMDVTKSFTFSDKFECVFARNLLHYFKGEEQENIIRRVYDALAPEGLFVFQLKSCEDFFYTDSSMEKKILDNGMVYFPRLGFSRNHLSEDEVRLLMKKTGFEIQKITSHLERLYNDPHESTIITVVARKKHS